MKVRLPTIGILRQCIAALSAFFLLEWLVPSAAAQSIIDTSGQSFGCDFVTGKVTASCVPWFIGHVIVFIFQFISILFVLNVIFAGYQLTYAYTTSGDKGAGMARLRYSIIGLIVSVCSFLIINLVLTVVLG